MKTSSATIRLTVGSLMLAAATWAVAQNGPAGDYSVQITDPDNAVWDLTSIEGLTSGYGFEVENPNAEVEVSFERELRQAGSGKLSGTGQADVALELWDESGYNSLDFPGVYKTSGSVIGSRGVCRIRINTTVSGIADLDGRNRRVTGSENLNVAVNNATLTSTGVSKTKASAAGVGSVSGVDSWSGEPIDNDFATWTLGLWDLATTGKKVTGVAEVQLHSGAVHEFSLKGTFNAKTGISKLVLMGQGVAKGANLVVTIGPEDFVTSVKGKIFGQMVNATFSN